MNDERQGRQLGRETEQRRQHTGADHDLHAGRQPRHGQQRADGGSRTTPPGRRDEHSDPRGEREPPTPTPQPMEASRLSLVHSIVCAMLTEISLDTPGSSIVMP